MRLPFPVLLPLVVLATGLAHAGERAVAGPPVPALAPVGPAVFRMPTLLPRPAGWRPAAPAGFRVEPFAEGLDGPRRLLVLPNGDVLVAQARTESMEGLPPAVVEALTRQKIFGPSADNVLLLRPGPQGVERHVLASGLNQPFGLLFHRGWLYVANTDALLRFRFAPGATRVDAPEKVLDLPAGPANNHWTRNLLASADGTRIWVTVGAATNVNEAGTDPPDRAAIWEVDPATGGHRLLATGLRNPVGLALEPETGALWTTVNERDGLGEDTPPDYLARVVDGAFYGWPYVYYGTYEDPTWKRRDPAKVADARARARVPDLALGGHSVPLGLVFRAGPAWPEPWARGAFVARRGGGGRVRYVGYDVAFVPFRGGAPTGAVEPFLAGFVASYDRAEVYGRPVDVAELPDGSLLVSDDGADVVWRVSADR